MIEITSLSEIQNLVQNEDYQTNQLIIAHIIKIFTTGQVVLFNDLIETPNNDIIYHFLFENEGFQSIEDQLIKQNVTQIQLINAVVFNSHFFQFSQISELILQEVSLIVPIYSDKLLSLTVIDSQIQDFSNLNFPNLTHFKASNCSFDTFPSYQNLISVCMNKCPISSYQYNVSTQKIKTISLIQCGLQKCDFLKDINPQILDLSSNSLFDFAFLQNMTNLQTFKLNNNKEDVSVQEYEHPFKFMVSIPWGKDEQYFEAKKNYLDLDTFPLLKNLLHLEMDSCEISTFPQRLNFPNLKICSLRNNLLRELYLKNFFRLNLEANQLNQITIVNCKHIRLSQLQNTEILLNNIQEIHIKNSNQLQIIGNCNKIILDNCAIQGGKLNSHQAYLISNASLSLLNILDKQELRFLKITYVDFCFHFSFMKELQCKFVSIKNCTQYAYLQFYLPINVQVFETDFKVDFNCIYEYSDKKQNFRDATSSYIQKYRLPDNDCLCSEILREDIYDAHRDEEVQIFSLIVRFMM